MTTSHEVALLRLVALGLVGPDAPVGAAATGVAPGAATTPEHVVHRLLACQAQDLAGALTSVALRTAARSRERVVAALDAAAVVRSWPMRGTLHLVAADDLGWLLATTGARATSRLARRRAELGLDEATVDRARDVATTALDDGRRLRRAELLAHWRAAGLPTDGQRGYHLVAHLAHLGVLCQGPMAGTEQLFVRADTWLPPVRDLDPDEALAELALRYLGSHGPATLADLARWGGITPTQARRGVAAVRDRLLPVDVAGTEHLMDPATPDRLAACRDQARGVLLLPGFDEYLLGYADRSAVLAPEHADAVVPGRNGVFRPTVLVDGRVVGTWRHGRDGQVDATPLEGLFSSGVREAVGEAYARLP